MTTQRTMTTVAALLVVLAGVVWVVVRDRAAPLQPPEIRLGHDVCSRCNMIISDARFAAAGHADTAEGREALLYDDIGCAIEHEREKPEMQVLARYVMDYQDKRWLDAAAAGYLRSKQLQSPMAYNIAARPDAAGAATLAERFPGDVLDLDGLRARVLGPDPAAMTDASALNH